MATRHVRRDLEQWTILLASQDAAGSKVDVLLGNDCGDGAVVIFWVVHVIERRVDGLVALHVEDAKRLAGQQLVNPRGTRQDHLAIDGVFGVELAFLLDESVHVSLPFGGSVGD